MNPADLPRHYRAAFTYHPEIKTFRRGRGSWKVADCYESGTVEPIAVTYLGDMPILHMDVPRKLRSTTFVNPTVLLRDLFAQRRVPC